MEERKRDVVYSNLSDLFVVKEMDKFRLSTRIYGRSVATCHEREITLSEAFQQLLKTAD